MAGLLHELELAMSADEAKALRVWLTEQFADRLHTLEELSHQRSDQMRRHTEVITQLQETDEEILDRLDKIDGYFKTLMNVRSFLIWISPLITFIAALFGVLWAVN